jgi:hypothetical protein
MPGPVSTASRCSQPLVGPSHLDPSIGRAICAQAPLEAHPRGSTQPPFTPPHQGQKAPFRTKARDIPEGGNVQVRAEMRAVATTRTMGGPVFSGFGVRVPDGAQQAGQRPSRGRADIVGTVWGSGTTSLDATSNPSAPCESTPGARGGPPGIVGRLIDSSGSLRPQRSPRSLEAHG